MHFDENLQKENSPLKSVPYKKSRFPIRIILGRMYKNMNLHINPGPNYNTVIYTIL